MTTFVINDHWQIDSLIRRLDNIPPGDSGDESSLYIKNELMRINDEYIRHLTSKPPLHVDDRRLCSKLRYDIEALLNDYDTIVQFQKMTTFWASHGRTKCDQYDDMTIEYLISLRANKAQAFIAWASAVRLVLCDILDKLKLLKIN